MKRTACLFLLILLCIGCFSCGRRGDAPADASASDCSETDAADNRETVSPDGYKDVPRRRVPAVRRIYCGAEGSSTALMLDIPEDWQFAEDGTGEGYEILRGDVPVGRLYAVQDEDKESGCLLHKEDRTATVAVTSCVRRSGSDRGCGYLQRILYRYSNESGEQLLVAEVDYGELSEFALSKLMVCAESTELREERGMGVLIGFRQSRLNKILILGNSFINTSAIGSTLQAMCDAGRGGSVDAVSIGYATVQSYVKNNPEILTRISNREYGVVLMCGFYSGGDAEALRSVVEVCRRSGTLLGIFPAHNESDSVIQSACSRWKDDAVFLDWRGEINDLIRYEKISRSDFCINDQHSHSTPLAGFVGAHMIYRALYGEIPPAIDYGGMTTADAYRILGDYVDTGKIKNLPVKTVMRFPDFRGK